MTLGEIIKKYRKEHGLSMDAFSKRSGISKSYISILEKNQHPKTGKPITPSVDSIKQAAIGMNMNFDELFSLIDSDITVKPKLKGIPSNIITPGAIPIPILGEICAGDGIYGEENFRGMFFIDQSVKADYCLVVHGDSMIDAGIYDGDIAFLQKDFELIDGEIYAVVFGAEDSATLKQLYRDGKTVILQPCNKEYKPIIVDYVDLYVVGLLVGVYHKID